MRGDSWFLAPVAELKTDAPDAPQGKPVNNGDMMATLDPRAEWQQMYRETWHIERDFFYDPHLRLSHRASLRDLWSERPMGGGRSRHPT